MSCSKQIKIVRANLVNLAAQLIGYIRDPDEIAIAAAAVAAQGKAK